MRPSSIIRPAGFFTLALCLASTSAPAQQATVSTPFVTTSDSFFEQTGVNWGLNFKNGFFRFSQPRPAHAPFGNAQPGAGMNFGFGGPGGYFNLGAAQGRRSSLVSQTPSVTLQNGVPGFIADTSVSPFVIGHIPVVGGRPAIPYSSFVAPPGGFGLYGTPSIPPMPAAQPGNWRVQQALQQRNQLRNDNRLAAGNAPGGNRPVVAANPPDDGDRAARPDPHPLPDPAVADAVSSAARPAPSLAEARRMHEQAGGQGDDEARRYFERGVTAEQSGKLSVARIYWKMALRRADGPLRERIQARLAALPD